MKQKIKQIPPYSSATLRVYGKFNDNDDNDDDNDNDDADFDDDADAELMLTMRVTNVDQDFNQLHFS